MELSNQSIFSNLCLMIENEASARAVHDVELG